MNTNNELDRLLDQALNEYRDAEPLSGIEDRVLRRITTQPEQSARRWPWILAAAAVAAVIAVALWLGVREHPHQMPVATNATQPARQTASSAHALPALPSVVSHPAVSARPRSRHSSSAVIPQMARAVAPIPRLTQFPSPAPMSSEEHALLALARTHPDALLGQPDDAEKLGIRPIEIKPLAPEAGAPQGEPQ